MVESKKKKKKNLSKSLPSPKNSTRLFLLMRGGREGSEGEGSRGGKEGRERGEGRREGGMGQRKRGGKEGRNNMRGWDLGTTLAMILSSENYIWCWYKNSLVPRPLFPPNTWPGYEAGAKSTAILHCYTAHQKTGRASAEVRGRWACHWAPFPSSCT